MITKKELLELVDAVFEDLASIDSGIKNGNLTEEMKKDYLFDLETLKRELSLFNLNTLTRELRR